MYPDFRNYTPDPALTHRDQALINLENKVGRLHARGLDVAGIAKDLRISEAAVAAIVERHAPTSPVRIRRGS